MKKVLAYDLGGTKVAVGVVNSRGRILTQVRRPVPVSKGKAAVKAFLIDLGRQFLDEHPTIQRVGLASAGPLDPNKGVLLHPTNLTTRGKSWGIVPITQWLRQGLKKPVTLENDAAAAVLAEHWMGGSRGTENLICLTLGTGVGMGAMVNGELVRAGRGLHTEGGHIIIGSGDRSARCACGNLGCAEAYLSGLHFARRFNLNHKRGWDAKTIADRAREGHGPSRRAFEEYAGHLSDLIQNLCVLYAPDRIVFGGSFAKASPRFLPLTRKLLKTKMVRKKDLIPKLEVSKLHNNSGVLGAAYRALK